MKMIAWMALMSMLLVGVARGEPLVDVTLRVVDSKVPVGSVAKVRVFMGTAPGVFVTVAGGQGFILWPAGLELLGFENDDAWPWMIEGFVGPADDLERAYCEAVDRARERWPNRDWPLNPELPVWLAGLDGANVNGPCFGFPDPDNPCLPFDDGDAGFFWFSPFGNPPTVTAGEVYPRQDVLVTTLLFLVHEEGELEVRIPFSVDGINWTTAVAELFGEPNVRHRLQGTEMRATVRER